MAVVELVGAPPAPPGRRRRRGSASARGRSAAATRGIELGLQSGGRGVQPRSAACVPRRGRSAASATAVRQGGERAHAAPRRGRRCGRPRAGPCRAWPCASASARRASSEADRAVSAAAAASRASPASVARQAVGLGQACGRPARLPRRPRPRTARRRPPSRSALHRRAQLGAAQRGCRLLEPAAGGRQPLARGLEVVEARGWPAPARPRGRSARSRRGSGARRPAASRASTSACAARASPSRARAASRPQRARRGRRRRAARSRPAAISSPSRAARSAAVACICSGRSRARTSRSRSRARSSSELTRASLVSARVRRRWYLPRPAASSTNRRRSCGLDVRISSTRPWPITECISRPEAGVGQQLEHVEPAHAGAVDQVLALAAAVEPAHHRHLAELERQRRALIVEHELDLADAGRRAAVGAAEEDVEARRGAQLRRRLHRHRPLQGVGDVRLAAAVRARRHGDARVEAQLDGAGERLEPAHAKRASDARTSSGRRARRASTSGRSSRAPRGRPAARTPSCCARSHARARVLRPEPRM